MALIQANIAKFYSKLGEFWNQGKYSDVIIECENKSFKCHRLALASASSYFDGMFGTHFKESIAEKVILQEISATTFEEVVRFVYTGDAVITFNNICDLLSASEFLDLIGVEDLCAQFIQNNHKAMTIQTVFDIFAFACTTRKTKLIELLCGYIVPNFEIFFNTKRFFEISFDQFRILLNRWSLSVFRNEDALLSAIIRWVHHSAERFQYVDEFMSVIPFENLSSMYVKSIIANAVKSNIAAVCQMNPLSGYNEDSELQNTAVAEPDPLSLHVFVKHREEKFARVFSIDIAGNCFLSDGKISVSHSRDRFRCIALNNYSYFYCLSYSGMSTTEFYQTFYAYDSINMHSEILLKPPPFILKRVEMCSIQNNLFVYNKFLFCPATSTYLQYSRLNDEEINHGIYIYNCKLDDWFPVPMMKKKLQGSSMTTFNNVLYLIGGDDENRKGARFAQAYDHRVREWQTLPEPKSCYTDAACSVVNEKIYVTGSRYKPCTQIEMFDPIAGKWEKVASMNSGRLRHRALPFINHLWLMGSSFNGESVVNNLSMDIYEPERNMWFYSSLVSETSEKFKTGFASGIIMDAVIFKSE